MDFKLIMAFVDEDQTDPVLAASRKAGATGATIIPNARGLGLEKTLGIFGLEILHPRDVVLVLVEARRSSEVLEAVKQAGHLDESLGTGIALEIDVNKAVGLSEHIKKLEEQIPPSSS